MKYALSLLAATAAVSAGPIQRRQSGPNDGDILNYALTLEHLENAFYRQGLANFTQADFAAAGFDSTFYQNLKETAYDENTHVSFLTTALTGAGLQATAECTYAFGVTSPASFVATASVLEGVGVTAYLGAAASIATKGYLTAAGSILTVEARHNAYIRAALEQSPFPQAFDVPLNFANVYTLAAPFIVSCPPSNPSLSSLGIQVFPALSVLTAGTFCTGSTIVLQAAVEAHEAYVAFYTVTGPVFATTKSLGYGKFEFVVPAGVHGQSYAVLSSNGTAVSDETIIAGPAIIEIDGTDGGN